VRAFRPARGGAGADTDAWPATVPAAAQLLREGLELAPGITILVGENGSGKSTVVEMLAEAYGLNPQGGSILAPQLRVRETEPRAGNRLVVEREPGRHAWAYFLRAETMQSLYTYLDVNRSPGRAPERLHELSHGEGFLQILRTRVNQPGFYLMDEPDAPLSFIASLGLVALLHDLAREHSQAIIATHSPIVAAVPGAHILELGEWGIRPARWADLEVVASWRDFLDDPQLYLRYLLEDLPGRGGPGRRSCRRSGPLPRRRCRPRRAASRPRPRRERTAGARGAARAGAPRRA
jgi:predicted ATPase